ncbi:MAG TPA: transglutaminase-like cysteine peptidase [Geminicoccaceae bacterium]|nr:transglutaminase-like cysteine peptidase [Geminicoccus sp.]HMU49161.1 transglutaminase-like cysteine peptidase [Geminicoccaceae bacterium]
MRRLLATTALALGLGFACDASAAPPSSALFGTLEFRSDSHAALPQWRRVLAGIERERASYAACAAGDPACGSRAAQAWQALLRGLEGAPEMQQAREVNNFLNQWRYRPDNENWGRSDYWATPLEFLRRSGDCEDYVIAKYVSLRSLGFPAERLRMVVLRDSLRNLAHAVLAAHIGDEVYVLDNLSNAVLPQSRLTHYIPYYSVNEESRWAHVAPGSVVVSAAAPLAAGATRR